VGKIINLKGITKSYNRGKIKAVDDLNLEINPGEIFGFLGPNGAGKTTTIKIMAGLLKPDSGAANIAGFDIREKPLEVKKRIGFVPDRPDIYEKLTGIEHLNFLADAFGMSANKRQERILSLLEMFEMENAVENLIQSYSHGMRQKIVLIGALMHDPEVIIMDEPMGGLDPRASFSLKEMMRRLAEEGRTIFFSTHVLEVAEKFCQRVGIINKGKLIASGTMEELQKMAERKESLEKIFLELTET